MAYSTDEDLFARLSEAQVQRLTDEAGTGEVDTALVARLREESTQYVDAWLRGHYELPLPEPAPPMLGSVEVSLLAARLYSRRPNVETPEGIRDDRKQAVKTLEKIAAGKIDLGIDSGADGEERQPARYRFASRPSTLADQMERY